MNITFVSDAIYPYNKGGKEKRLYELSTRLSKLGHDVHIYTMHWWDTPETSRTEHGVQLHAISKLIPMYSGDKRSVKEGVLFGLACFRLFRVQFDVLDVDHMPFFPIYSAWVVCRLRGRKLHGTWHEALSRKDWTSYMGPAGNIAAVIERVSIHLPYGISTSSEHTKKLIASTLKRNARVNTVAGGIDTQLIHSVTPAAVQCHILYAGRLVKDKNVDVLVRAVGIIAKSNPSIRCTIIGHGVEKESIAALIKQLHLQKQINLLEPLADAQDVYAYMKASKVFCLPSVREGFGIVALEALGCGTPVITTNSPANAAKDLVQDGKNGSVVLLSPVDMAKAITSWVERPKPRGVAKEVAHYDWDSLAKKQSELYAA